jgi:hypothetical protein
MVRCFDLLLFCALAPDLHQKWAGLTTSAAVEAHSSPSHLPLSDSGIGGRAVGRILSPTAGSGGQQVTRVAACASTRGDRAAGRGGSGRAGGAGGCLGFPGLPCGSDGLLAGPEAAVHGACLHGCTELG